MSIQHTELWNTSTATDTDASTPESTARAFLEAAHTHPLGSPQHQALVQEAGVHATLAQVWATEALLSRVEELQESLTANGNGS